MNSTSEGAFRFLNISELILDVCMGNRRLRRNLGWVYNQKMTSSTCFFGKMVKFILSLLSNFSFLSHGLRFSNFQIQEIHVPREFITTQRRLALIFFPMTYLHEGLSTRHVGRHFVLEVFLVTVIKWRSQSFSPPEAQRVSPRIVKMNSQWFKNQRLLLPSKWKRK